MGMGGVEDSPRVERFIWVIPSAEDLNVFH